MSGGLQVRRAEAADRAAIGRLINGIQRSEFAIPITLEDQPDLADIEGFYRKGAGGFWVADSEGRIIGTIALIDIGQHEGALRKMFVDADFRGSDKAVARRLLDALLDHARDKGLKRVYLGTTAKFLAAHRFYEKNGFDLVEENALPDRFPRMAVDTRFYCMTL